jgi:phosphoserine phosphatase
MTQTQRKTLAKMIRAAMAEQLAKHNALVDKQIEDAERIYLNVNPTLKKYISLATKAEKNVLMEIMRRAMCDMYPHYQTLREQHKAGPSLITIEEEIFQYHLKNPTADDVVIADFIINKYL